MGARGPHCLFAKLGRSCGWFVVLLCSLTVCLGGRLAVMRSCVRSPQAPTLCPQHWVGQQLKQRLQATESCTTHAAGHHLLLRGVRRRITCCAVGRCPGSSDRHSRMSSHTSCRAGRKGWKGVGGGSSGQQQRRSRVAGAGHPQMPARQAGALAAHKHRCKHAMNGNRSQSKQQPASQLARQPGRILQSKISSYHSRQLAHKPERPAHNTCPAPNPPAGTPLEPWECVAGLALAARPSQSPAIWRESTRRSAVGS